MEICKREGGDPEEKGVDRLLGLGSARCGESGRGVGPGRGQVFIVLSPQWLCGPRGAVPGRQGGRQIGTVSIHGNHRACVLGPGVGSGETREDSRALRAPQHCELSQHHRVDSGGPGAAAAAARKKPRAEDKAEQG